MIFTMLVVEVVVGKDVLLHVSPMLLVMIVTVSVSHGSTGTATT
jgi:hypothetical protein